MCARVHADPHHILGRTLLAHPPAGPSVGLPSTAAPAEVRGAASAATTR
jgi:hypothetical protein